MQLQPPTDSLYKFMAIGGLAALIASCFFYTTQNSESYSKRLKLEQEFHAILDEFHITFGSRIAHEGLWREEPAENEQPFPFEPVEDEPAKLENTLAFSVANAISDKDRQEVLKHINLHYEQLGKLMSSPSRDLKIRTFWQKWFDLNEQQMDEWLASNSSPLADIRKKAKEFRPRYEKSLPLVKEIWMIEDTYRDMATYCQIGAVSGLVFMGLGFVLWFVKIQCIQDEILRLDLQEKQEKLS